MSGEVVVEFKDGRKLHFETGGGTTGGVGLREASVGKKIAKASTEQFEGALGTLGDLIDILEKSIAKVASKPTTVELTFGASLKGDLDLWVVKGESEAQFSVTLTWENKTGKA